MMNSNPLVPNTIAGVLDRAFRIYRENFVAFIGLVAIVTIPLTIITTSISNSLNESLQQSFAFSNQGELPELPSEYWLLIIVSILGAFVQGVIVNGMITYVASENHLGYRTTIADAFNTAKGRLGTLALGLIMFGVIFAIGFVVVIFTGAMCLVPLLALPILLYLGLCIYFFIIPIIMLEGIGASAAMIRALALGKARFWQTFGVFLLIELISAILGFVLGVLISLVTGSSTTSITTSGSANTLFIIFTTAINIFVIPMLPIALTIMYYDVRVRTEGLDIALQAVDKPDPRPDDVVSPQPQGRLLSGQDFGNILLLVIGVIGLVLLLGILGNLFTYTVFGF